MDMKSFVTLTDLVQRGGPFAFSLVFMFLMGWWGQGKYQTACDKNPPASDREKHVYLCYFLGTTAIGIVLVALSLWWWWTHQPNYLYEGRIDGVQDIVSLDGDQFFVQNVYSRATKSGPQVFDYRFVVVSPEPFKDGDFLTLRLARDNDPSSTDVQLPVMTGVKPRFGLKFEDEKGWALQLKKDKRMTPTASFFGEAHAQSRNATGVFLPSRPASSSYGMPPPLIVQPVVPTILPPVAPAGEMEMIKPVPSVSFPKIAYSELLDRARELADPSVLVSQKIRIINTFLSVSRSVVDMLMAEDGYNEPLFLELMDLTRHTDKELAFKARKLVESSRAPLKWFRGNLANENKKIAEMYLYRIDPNYAKAVIAEMDSRSVKIVQKVRDEVLSDTKARLLVPTGTSRGDRYYVQAEWKPGDETAIKCIAKIFNTSVSNNRSYERELELMRTAKMRIGFDESKSWPLDMAERIEKCGGKPSFVGYYVQ